MKNVIRKIAAILLAVLMLAASFSAIADDMPAAPDALTENDAPVEDVPEYNGAAKINSNSNILMAVGDPLTAGTLGASGDVDPDTNFIRVEKRFSGISYDLIPSNFQINVGDYKLTPDTAVSVSSDRLVYQWEIPLKTDKELTFSVSESNWEIPGYDATCTNGKGEPYKDGSVTITPPKSILSDEGGILPSCSSTNFDISNSSKTNTVLCITSNKAKAALVISEKPLSAVERLAVIEAAKADGASGGNWYWNDVTYYSLQEKIAAHDYECSIDGAKVTIHMNGTQYAGTVQIEATSEWTQAYKGVINHVPGQDADININNAYTPQTTTVTATKEWADDTGDGFDYSGYRPSNFALILNANGNPVTDVTPAVNKNGAVWTYTWENVPKVDSKGTMITYTVTETNVGPSYEADKTSVANGETITNKFQTTEVAVEKIWKDVPDGVKKPNVTVYLMNDTTKVADATLTEDGEWSHTWTNLPKFDTWGNEVEYIVKEDEANLGDYVCGEPVKGEGNSWTITNTYNLTSITATKVWEGDEDYKEITRPSSVTFTLTGKVEGRETPVYSNTQTFGETDGSWTKTWDNLFIVDTETGKTITYTVDEAEVTGYTKQNEEPVGKEENYTITNKLDTVDFIAQKIWEDNGSALRPVSLELTLKANGEKFEYADGSLTVTSESDRKTWTYKWINLPKNTYSISEDTVPVGYRDDAEYPKYGTATVDGKPVPTVTNALDTVDVHVKKTWVNDVESHAAASVTLQEANGDPITTDEATKPLNTSGTEWEYTWTGLPAKVKTDAGVVDAVYKVTEAFGSDADAALYETPVITEVTESEYDFDYSITNTRKTTSFTLKKLVGGNMGDREKEFPFTVTYTHLKPGTTEGTYEIAVDDVATPSLKHDGTFAIENVLVGTDVVITETKANTDGYLTTAADNKRIGTPSDDGAVYTIIAEKVTKENEGAIITFTNVKDAIIDNGIVLDSLPYILILLAVAAVVVLGVIRKRRNRD